MSRANFVTAYCEASCFLALGTAAHVLGIRKRAQQTILQIGRFRLQRIDFLARAVLAAVRLVLGHIIFFVAVHCFTYANNLPTTFAV